MRSNDSVRFDAHSAVRGKEMILSRSFLSTVVLIRRYV